MTGPRAFLVGLGYGGGVAAGPLLALLLLAPGCPKPPIPPPVSPGASGTGGRPAPIANPEPGPVPAGDPGKCAAAARHADDVCPGSLAPTVRACARAGGADPGLIPCIMAADGCQALKCDALSRAARATR